MLASITWGTYIFFGCCCFGKGNEVLSMLIILICSVAFAYKVMSCAVFIFYPETKGRSLEEMDEVFSGSVLAFRDRKATVSDKTEQYAGSVDEIKA